MMTKINLIIIYSLMILTTGCNSKKQKNTTLEQDEPKQETALEINDKHSFANLNEISVNHLDINMNINFDEKKINATATWSLDRKKASDVVILDTKHLTIENVKDELGEKLDFELGKTDEILGTPLIIHLKEESQKVQIAYSTTSESEALMWLDAEQTAGKKHPFLFTQSQAILARTWLPCQDGPGVRFTYQAEVQVPAELMVAMSAENATEKNPEGKYSFSMKQAIPSYLMALVCGDLVYEKLGSRTGVFAEPSLIEAAAYELGDMQKMLEAAETLYGPYRWEQYDVVFLPPSFPFGGMENPRLTFATPTIITGDRSLTALIAHELAHSWSGNLVTNATWDDFWLNEGFTVYFEQRIMEHLYGRDYAEMLALLSYQGLLKELDEFEAKDQMEDTHLKLDLQNRNPDDGLSAIAYDKGYLFLRMLEEAYGRTAFDLFLKNYFQKHAFKVMTTEEFIVYLQKELLDKDSTIAKNCLVEEWIFQPGLPANCPQISSNKFALVDESLSNWQTSKDISAIKSEDWNTHQWIHFVKNLPKDVSEKEMMQLDNAFNFSQLSNAEIQCEWFQIAVRLNYEPAFEKIDSFLVNIGRRKFLTPIYKQLIQTKEGKAMAKDIYTRARPNYHAVARLTIDDLVN